MVARRDVLPCLAEKLLSWRDLPLFLALRGFSTIKTAEKTRNSISAGIKIHPCLIAMPSSICNGGHRLGGKIRVTVRRKVAQEWALGFTKSTSKRGQSMSVGQRCSLFLLIHRTMKRTAIARETACLAVRAGL